SAAGASPRTPRRARAARRAARAAAPARCGRARRRRPRSLARGPTRPDSRRRRPPPAAVLLDRSPSASSATTARERAARAGLYAGGYLGPFGGGVIAVLIPELRHAFHASTAEVTAGITAYLVPFAALQVVSGTLGERVGVARAPSGRRTSPTRSRQSPWRRRPRSARSS